MTQTEQQARDFLVRHGMDASCIDADSLLAEFDLEMRLGLAGDESSLAMIPTFLGIDSPVPRDEPVIVIDAGGTNLRVAVVRIGSDNQVSIEGFRKYAMPGVAKELSKEEFFGAFADYLDPVIGESDRIGFCFSYPSEIFPDCDGRLLCWTKEVKAPEVEEQFVGRGILTALGDRGKGKRVTVLNDTIATLLAGKVARGGDEHESFAGVILGTGTNAAYVESNRNITKRNDLDPERSQAINIESGNFSKFPRGSIDLDFDSMTDRPGWQALEKAIAGAYLGGLCLHALRVAVGEGLFSEGGAAFLAALPGLSTKEMDDFVADPSCEGPFSGAKLADADGEMIRQICRFIVSRASLLTAVNISAAVLKSGGGRGSGGSVCINIDGSTYYKTTGFRESVEERLTTILGSRGVRYELVHADDSPLLGAAIAGLSR